MSQSAETLRRFRQAGKRGVTRRELEQVAGVRFERVISRLEERQGCIFIRHSSRFSPRTFRWVLAGEFPPPAAKPVPPEINTPADVLLADCYEEQRPLPLDEAVS